MPAVKKIKGRYVVKGVLGEGGMGVVYRAYDPPPMNREVALKTLLEFPDRTSLQLFYKECDVLMSMSHPNIVEIFDKGEFEDDGLKKPFFVMPLLRGTTLDALIRNASHRLSVERVVEIMSQTCRGLQAAHEAGLVHRDLKPSNLWVMEDDSVKIIDFGVAHKIDARSRTTGFQKGTLLYMAPEQIQFKPVSPQSDIFSLGVICYEALTRRQPFRGTTEEQVVNAILNEMPPPASEINPAVNGIMSRVVHKAMAKQPWSRFDTAREFGEALRKALNNQPIELFDPARLRPRIQRAQKALENGDYQFAGEIVTELEAEGNLDPELTLLRTQIDQVVRQKTIAQLLESARARYEEDEDPLALHKIQEILQLDPNNAAALGLKNKIENRRSERQTEKWLRLARQHVDNHSYSHAREALRNVTQINPNEPRALRLLSYIEGEEKEYLQLRQRKAQLYQSALNAWKNGEISQALAHMGAVLELDRQAPDTSAPETSSAYQNFFNKLSSEHDTINNGYAEANRALSKADYAKALKLCHDFLARYPNHALFQALKFDVEEQQRQQLSAFIADVDRRLEAERDLDAKVNLLREALATYPGEAHFERSLRIVTDKRDLVNSILARARSHEESSQINEALSDLETLAAIYSPYPGLQFEVERLQKRREQQVREEAKARWVEQINRELRYGNYARALELLQKAQSEFASDPELSELQKSAQNSFERASEAERLLARGRELFDQGEFGEAVTILKQARQLDERNPGIPAVLGDALAQQANATLDRDWRVAEVLVTQALELDPSHALARSIRTQINDRKRDEAISARASNARRLQAAGDLQGAAVEIETGLRDHPRDPRLTIIRESLTRELNQVRHKQQRSQDLQNARGLQYQAENLEDADQLQSIYEQTQSFVAKYPEEPELQTIAREVERIVRARAGRKPAPESKAQTPKPAPQKNARLAVQHLLERLRRVTSKHTVQLAAGIIGVLLVAFAVWRYWPVHPALIPIEIHTTPPGARIRINGFELGTSNLSFGLPAGDYQVEASLPGYETAINSIAVARGKPSSFEVTLQPSAKSLRVTTNLEQGQVWLDDKQIGVLKNGSFGLPDPAPGPHSLRIVAGPSDQDATIQFQATSEGMAVSQPLQARQLQVVVVSTSKDTAHVVSSLGALPVTADTKPLGQLGPEGLQITGLSAGVHELVLGAGKDLHKMSFEAGGRPGLDAIIFSDRDVGSILVQVGNEDDVDVFVDGKTFPEKTKRGRLRISNLTTETHTVRVHREGFKDPEEQTIDIKKGQEARLNFALPPSRVASLRVERMPAGTQVSLDSKGIGTVGSDGNLSRDGVAVGPHVLVFSRPGYTPKCIEKKFGDGESVVLSNSDIQFKPAQAALDIVAGTDTSVTIIQAGCVVQSFIGSRKVPLGEGIYTVDGRGKDFVSSQSVRLNSGESKLVNLRVSANGMEGWETFNSWTEQGGWFSHRGGGFLLYGSPQRAGAYHFTLKFRPGHDPFSGGPRVRWFVGFLDDKNYTLIQLDGKFLYRTVVVNGKQEELPKITHNIPTTVTLININLDVSSARLTHRYSLAGNDWKPLDDWMLGATPTLRARPQSFTNGKFGFYLPGTEVVELANFSFSPKH